MIFKKGVELYEKERNREIQTTMAGALCARIRRRWVLVFLWNFIRRGVCRE